MNEVSLFLTFKSSRQRKTLDIMIGTPLYCLYLMGKKAKIHHSLTLQTAAHLMRVTDIVRNKTLPHLAYLYVNHIIQPNFPGTSPPVLQILIERIYP